MGASDRMGTRDKQKNVLEQAFDIFLQRNKVHRDLFEEGGCEDSLHHMKHKLARIQRQFANLPDLPPDGRFDPSLMPEAEELVDDALDLINYTAFFIRNLREGRLRGDDGEQ